MERVSEEYWKPSVTADIVAVDIHYAKYRSDGAFVNLVLIKRNEGSEAYPGQWALPGGFLEKGESLPECCIREFKEETGLDAGMLAPIGVFSRPERDPRGQVISNAYLTVLMSTDEQPLQIHAGDDAKEIGIFKVKGAFSQKDGTLSVRLHCAKNKTTIEFTASFSRDRLGLVSTKIAYKSLEKLAFDHAEILARAILKNPDLVIQSRQHTIEQAEETETKGKDKVSIEGEI